MTTTLSERLPLTDEQIHEPLPVELMSDAAQKLAWHEEQLNELPSDQLAIARDDKERLIDRLLGERPGETLINEITYLAQLYEGRSVQYDLPDGSAMTTWGTRDSSLQYLNLRYYVQHRTDGTLRYRVNYLNEEGRTLFDIDDQGDMQVVKIARSKFDGDFRPYRPAEAGPEGVNLATRVLFEASMLSAATVHDRTRDESQAADLSALTMLASGPVEADLFEAQTQSQVDRVFIGYLQPRSLPKGFLDLTDSVHAA